MKKSPLYLAIIVTTMGIWGSFLVPSASAQSIIFQQPFDNAVASSSNGSPSSFQFNLGEQSFVGSSSAMSVNVQVISAGSSVGFQVFMDSFVNSDFSGSPVNNCLYSRTFSSGTVSGRQILSTSGYGGDSCNFEESAVPLYWKFSIFVSGTSISSIEINGAGTNSPYFVYSGSYLDLVPTITSSQLSLTGAVDFCNAQFASTTGIGGTIMNGLCVVGGYLVIPSYSSVENFSTTMSTAQEKIPFSYGYEIASIFGALTASSTQNMPTYVIPLAAIDFASSTPMGSIFPTSLDFLSSSTIETYLPDGMHDLLYNFAIFVIWIEAAYLIYHKVVPQKAKI